MRESAIYFYVETNSDNASYGNDLNTKISKSTLMNASAWNVIINSDNSFDITLGYYPILKMNKFMNDVQQFVKIPFDYFGETKIDILSTEVLHNNVEGENGIAEVKVYVSNPNKYKIKSALYIGRIFMRKNKFKIFKTNM